jgi:glycosyltransferase involved in cell wall biosynthesis
MILFKGRKYMNRCLRQKINRKINKFVNPRVTIIIPIYNCQNSIKQAIRSIQNQKMIDIEIILVNDKSNDKSLKIIKNFQKTDKRIKIINNKKNMGTLYSRSIGALQAKGKYIIPLDNDDMFLIMMYLILFIKKPINSNMILLVLKLLNQKIIQQRLMK